MIAKINGMGTTWTAGENKFFAGKSIAHVQMLLGVPLGTKQVKPKETVSTKLPGLPQNFTIDNKWPGCAGYVRNQADCGSCWAFGAVESISDRFCIAGKNVSLSALDLVTCDNNDNGCFGGMPISAMEFIQRVGVVDEACRPYDIPTCPPEQQPCLHFVDTPSCVQSCKNSENYNDAKNFLSRAYGVDNDPRSIQSELFAHGSVEGAFTVYEDFVHYKSGVYSHQSGSALGGHAIKIIGWGVENDTPYWMCQNSWTTTWGDGGYFKILRGQDECGIEDGIVAGDVRV
jgi:cathepsin B